ncbi:MAG: DMT family transporter [Firmicutes bacterium]|nr:DMT family transporter [Bacillota bacterium]
MKDSLKGSLLLFITAFIWGIAFAFQRSGMEYIGPITFMAARCFLAVIFLAVLCMAVYGPSKAFKFNRATLAGGLGCGVLMTVANNLQQMGMVYTEAGKAGFITAMYILIVPILNVLIFRRKEPVKTWIAVLLGILGLYLLCASGTASIDKGDILVFGCAVFFSGHILCSDRFAAKAEIIKMSFLQFLVSFVLSTVTALLTEDVSFAAIWDGRIAVAYCGILSAGVGYTLQIFGQKSVKPAAASLIMSFESVFAVIGGWLLLHETLSARELLGCAVMFAAIVLVQLQPAKRE